MQAKFQTSDGGLILRTWGTSCCAPMKTRSKGKEKGKAIAKMSENLRRKTEVRDRPSPRPIPEKKF
jgi:hypothetical protein